MGSMNKSILLSNFSNDPSIENRYRKIEIWSFIHEFILDQLVSKQFCVLNRFRFDLVAKGERQRKRAEIVDFKFFKRTKSTVLDLLKALK